MADTVLPTSSRRDRDRLRRQQRRRVMRLVAGVVGVAVGIIAVLVTTDLVRFDDPPPRLTGASGATPGPVLPEVEALAAQEPPRPLSHDEPLRLWVGGDSLAGSVGPALGEIAGETGVVDTQVDYKVSSGIASDGVRDWPERAAQQMAEHDPEAVVFIIGTNDASIVNSRRNDDGVYEWEPRYRMRVAQMMDLFVGGEKHRTVIWVGAPTMATGWRDKGVVELNRVMREEADRRDDVVYLDAYSLFADERGNYAASLHGPDGKTVRVRNEDGVHFTPAGAERLARAAYSLLDARWEIDEQADLDRPIKYSFSAGSGGGGTSRPFSSSGSDSGVSDTTTTVVTWPTVTDPPATTPPPTSAPAVATTTTSAPTATTTAPPATTTTTAPTTTVAEASAEP